MGGREYEGGVDSNQANKVLSTSARLRLLGLGGALIVFEGLDASPDLAAVGTIK